MKEIFKSIYFVCLILTLVKCHQIHHEYENEQPSLSNVNQPNPTHNITDQLHIDKEHVKELVDGVVNKSVDAMTEEERNFYHFKLHDYDNNNSLDGIELISAITENDSK